MLKWLLVGWMCTGVGQEKVCLRMASEVIHENFDQCDQYYGVIAEELRAPNITLQFDCVQAYIVEDNL
jgi:hypothetical protein|tara:strand:- start:1104 stop:1307 length:204 start_codon:yes stop_codon:yes gene_type:complete